MKSNHGFKNRIIFTITLFAIIGVGAWLFTPEKISETYFDGGFNCTPEYSRLDVVEKNSWVEYAKLNRFTAGELTINKGSVKVSVSISGKVKTYDLMLGYPERNPLWIYRLNDPNNADFDGLAYSP